MLPGMELMSCPNLAVPKDVMHHVVRVESSYNPYAIGVVGGRLARQPQNLAEALATVRMLEAKGYNFSLGLAQVNRYNLGKYGIDSYEKAFDACANLQTGSRILAECHSRSGGDWGKSFSCYYSGNFTAGFRHGYVQKIYASMRGKESASTDRYAHTPIKVTGKPSRRTVEVMRYPVYDARKTALQRIQTAYSPPQTGQSEQPAVTQQAITIPAIPSRGSVPVATTVRAAHESPASDGPLEAKPAEDAAFVF